jgi:superfamily II DNA or RNA helicase
MIDKHTPMFDSLVKSPQTNWFVENRYLAPADQYCGKVINLDTIPVKQGEYDNDMLMAKRHEMTDLLDSYFKYAMGKKTIVFAINVKHSKEIAQRYQNAGISAVHVDGTTPDREREAIMRKFKSGEIKVLCNVDIVSEGFDVPDCEVVQMARPVRSLSLYLQQGGRALRPSENKRAIILDNACNYLRHGHITADREWDLEGDYEIVQGKKKKRKKKPEDDEFKVAKELPTEVMGGMVLINPKQDAVEHEKRLFEAKLSEIITIQEARSYKPLSIFFKAKELGIIKTPEQFDYIKNVVSLKGYQEVGGFWHWRKKEMFAVSNNLPKNSYIAV